MQVKPARNLAANVGRKNEKHMRLTVLILIIYFTCPWISKAQNDLFKKYYDQIDLCKLPVSFDCFADSIYSKYSDIAIANKDLIDKFQPQGSRIFGRLKTQNDFVSIIYLISADFYYPTIFTFKLDGTPIDTLSLYSGGSCDAFPENWIRNTAVIDKYDTFLITDTAGTYKLNFSTGEKVTGTDSVVVSRYIYNMDKFGYFKLVKSTKTKKQKLK